MFNTPFFSKSSTNTFLGVDIGKSSLKIVEISGEKEITLENYGELFMRDFTGKSPVKESEWSLFYSSNEIAEAMKYLLKEAEIKARNAYFSIPDFVSFFAFFTIPPMKREEVVSAIELHSRQYIPFPVSDAALDCFLEEEEEGKPRKVNLIAIPNKVISQYQEISRLSGVKIISLEGEMFSLIRALAGNIKETTAIINIGEQGTMLTIAENGSLKKTQRLEVTGSMMTKQVAKYAEIEYNEARDVLLEYGAEEETIKKIIFPSLTSLFSEISHVISSFEEKEGKKIDEVLVTGEFSFLPGMIDYAEKDVGKKVSKKSCFEGLNYPETLREELERISSSHSTALGVALNGREREKYPQ